jgi:hypothetical protein
VRLSRELSSGFGFGIGGVGRVAVDSPPGTPPPPVQPQAPPVPASFNWAAYAEQEQQVVGDPQAAANYQGPAQMGLPATAPSPIKVLPNGSVEMPSPPSGSASSAAAVTPLASSVAYGWGDSSACTVEIGSTWHFCPDQSSTWNAFRSGLGISYVRIRVPWDIVGTRGASGCVYNQNAQGNWNEVADNGVSWIGVLLQWLAAARANNLTPVVALMNGNGSGGAVYPDADGAHGVGQDTGDLQYDCAFYELGVVLNDWNLPVSYWETYNEPDNNSPSGSCNAWCVAANYYLDAYYSDRLLLQRTDSLIAGAFNFSSVNNSCCTWVDGYLKDLWANLVYYGWPAPSAISGHPYNDPTFGGDYQHNWTNGTQNLVNQTNTWFNGEPIWITETGVWLHDPTPFENGTDGSYENGNGLNQAYGAQSFKAIASVSQVKAVFWYEFETASNDPWDSALLGIGNADSTVSGEWNGANEWGDPRPSFCVLAYGDSPSSAVSDSRCQAHSQDPQNPLTDWEG